MLNPLTGPVAPLVTLLTAGLAMVSTPAAVGAMPAPITAAQIVAGLDTEFQAAVKRNDADVMGRILADNAVLVTGRGAIFTREQQLEAARNQERTYEQQDEVPGTQMVRVWGDSAVVTALLWIKGVARNGPAFDYRLWFSDTYVRTPTGWRYAFGQASLSLPPEAAK